MKASITVLPGDGIGPEVTEAAVSVLQGIADCYGHQFSFEHALIGATAIDETGNPLPESSLKLCRDADAILLGAVGDPRYDDPSLEVRPEQGLLSLRRELGLFANLRPVSAIPALLHASPLKAEILDGVDLMVVRELTGGLYFGEKSRQANEATDLCRYHRDEVERIIHVAAKLARTRRNRLTLVDKANVLETSRLWREVTVGLMQQEYPDVEFDICLVDAMAMHLIQCPRQYDVIVTENLFGDILTDEASVLAGSMGLLPSASLGKDGPGLYEPIHGSAPDLAGSGRANPFATLLSAAMMLQHSLGLISEAASVHNAVHECLDTGQCTADIGGNLSTREATDAVLSQLKPLQARAS